MMNSIVGGEGGYKEPPDMDGPYSGGDSDKDTETIYVQVMCPEYESDVEFDSAPFSSGEAKERDRAEGLKTKGQKEWNGKCNGKGMNNALTSTVVRRSDIFNVCPTKNPECQT